MLRHAKPKIVGKDEECFVMQGETRWQGRGMLRHAKPKAYGILVIFLREKTLEYFDISPTIKIGTPVFPGDQEFERQVTMDIKQGDHLGLSWIKSTLHIGAHADAPSHYHRDGASIERRDLNLYMGPCQVVDVQHVGSRRILPGDFLLDDIQSSRVLFKSCSFRHSEAFQMQFTSLSPELIEALAKRGVRLVGIDTPSVDPSDSKDLPSHQALYRNDFAVLEGLDLDQVPAGSYNLIALPLALGDADASPVRAILIGSDASFT